MIGTHARAKMFPICWLTLPGPTDPCSCSMAHGPIKWPLRWLSVLAPLETANSQQIAQRRRMNFNLVASFYGRVKPQRGGFFSVVAHPHSPLYVRQLPPACMPDPSQLVARASTGAPAANPTAEIWALFAVGAAATILRLYSRVSLHGFRDLRADDFLASLAVVSMPRMAVDGDANCDRYSLPLSRL